MLEKSYKISVQSYNWLGNNLHPDKHSNMTDLVIKNQRETMQKEQLPRAEILCYILYQLQDLHMKYLMTYSSLFLRETV